MHPVSRFCLLICSKQMALRSSTVKLLSYEHLVRTSDPEILGKTHEKPTKNKDMLRKPKHPRVPSRD